MQLVRLPELHLARDHTRQFIAARLRSGRWVRVRSGVYVSAEPSLDRYAQRRRLTLARIAALFATASDPMSGVITISHQSAALLLGLPTVDSSTEVHVMQPWRRSGQNASDVVRHCRPLSDAVRTMRCGLPVTSLERTVVDCAMVLPPRDGLIIADAGMYNGADPELCLEILEQMRGQRGVAKAREILSLADSGPESPSETKARFYLLRAGFPKPETQVYTNTEIGEFWSDIGWPEWKLVLEYDGLAKYTASGTATEAVLHERRRERAIEATGKRLLHVVSDDLRRPATYTRQVAEHIPASVRRSLRPRPILNS